MSHHNGENQLSLPLLSQREAIKRHLLAGYSITQAEAARLFNCYRLSERIREIEREVGTLTHEREANASGRGHHMRYKLSSAWHEAYIEGDK